MSDHLIRAIPGTRNPVGGEPVRGKRDHLPCARCGRTRQVNRAKIHEDGLCADCRSVDPNVWSQHIEEGKTYGAR